MSILEPMSHGKDRSVSGRVLSAHTKTLVPHYVCLSLRQNCLFGERTGGGRAGVRGQW